MTDYYGYQRYGSRYMPGYYHDEIEYPGYDDAWVLGRDRGLSYRDNYHHTPRYGQRYQGQRHPQYRLGGYPSQYDNGHVQLAWATEIPLKLRVSLCCEGCKLKLDKVLRDTQGVHDVSISGWTNAVVTVTGTAAAHKILNKARKISKSAELYGGSGY